MSAQAATLSNDEAVFSPQRWAGLQRMRAFAPSMGSAYARSRNFDFGPDQPTPDARSNVSVLSPYTRHRLVLEEELARTALETHNEQASEKFVQEVIWRTYWKGWLEHRPDVWTDFLIGLEADQAAIDRNGGMRRDYERAVAGDTGIACFDAWAKELVATGYLHNHARMWFASIWIHTLRLPWTMGAAFFLHYLLDGDAASNTLSWRWVAGLHTKGKTYLARADNIEKFTARRFRPAPSEFSPAPRFLEDDAGSEREPLPFFMPPKTEVPTALLMTSEDCAVEEGLFPPKFGDQLVAMGTFQASANPDAVGESEMVAAYRMGALNDAGKRAETHFGITSTALASEEALLDWFAASGAQQLALSYVPAGETRARLAPALQKIEANGASIAPVARDWDKAIWPHATAGFFKVKKKIPSVLRGLGLV
ncbi:MAG: FAD-binding domain-containing protein [Pseudomonadota bacterium]